MFPYVMLCTTPMFCYPDWPRRLSYYCRYLIFLLRLTPKPPQEPETPDLVANENCIYDKKTVKNEEKAVKEKEEEGEEQNGGKTKTVTVVEGKSGGGAIGK